MPSPTRKRRTPDPKAYQIVVRWTDEDDCYVAEVPALPGCVTHGDSLETAIRNGQEAAHLWLEDAVEHGDRIPKPVRRMSGKMTIRMPASLHQRVAEAAEREGISINQWVVTRLASQ